MKKLFLLFSALFFAFTCVNFNNASMPAALGKKIIYDEEAVSKIQSMPAIKTMTYNIHRGINKENKLDLDRIAEVIQNSEAEIIALQEVERFSVRTRFQDQIEYIADKLAMHYAYGKSMQILNWQYGNAILSKYPIAEYEVYQLPSKGEQRTLLRAGLNVHGRRISFYTTHLGLDKDERDMQIQEIVKLISGDGNYILSGDFNSRVDKLGLILESSRDCADFADDVDKATFEGKGMSERIDYIFVSQDFDIIQYDVLDSDASDHYPVTGTLKFID